MKINESENFKGLAQTTKAEWGDGRHKRSKYVDKVVKPSIVLFKSGNFFITFSAKSFGRHSTTGKTFNLRVTFFPDRNKKESIQKFIEVQKRLNNLDRNKPVPNNILSRKDLSYMKCKVNCNCPDYVYRMEYANHKIGAANIVSGNGQYPEITNPAEKPGLCKHLLGLLTYLSGGGQLSAVAKDSWNNEKTKNPLR